MTDCLTCADPREEAGAADIEDMAGTNRLNAEAAHAAHARVNGGAGHGANLRSRRWFNDPHDIGMTSLYLERCVGSEWLGGGAMNDAWFSSTMSHCRVSSIQSRLFPVNCLYIIAT